VPKLLSSVIAVCAICAVAAAPSSLGQSDVAAVGIVTVLKSGDGTITSEGSGAIACGSRCRAELPEGTKLLLVASPPNRFDYWGDLKEGAPCTGSATRCQLVVEKRTLVRARFSSGETGPKGNDQYVTVAGRGIVRSDGSSTIECGSVPIGKNCKAALTRGIYTLRATPAQDSIFVQWSGVPGCERAPVCRVNVSAKHSIAATFRRQFVADGTSRLQVEVVKVAPGNRVRIGSSVVCPPTCERRFANKSLVKLTAEDPSTQQDDPANWSGPSCVGTGVTCVIAIAGSESASADFRFFQAFDRKVVRVTRSGPGTVKSSPEGISCGAGRLCSALFKVDNVTLTATTDATHYPTWPGRTGPDCAGDSCTVPATVSGTDVMVRFEAVTDEFKVAKSGDGEGRVTSDPTGIDCGTDCTHRFVRGASVTLRAKASPGSHFVGWGAPCSGTGRCTVIVGPQSGQATSVTARFDATRAEVRVTKAGDGGGTVRSTPTGISCGNVCAASFPLGTRVELRAEPNDGSRFVGWSGGCKGTGVCTIASLEGAKAVTARFDRARDKVQVVKSGGGRGTVTSSPPGISCGRQCSGLFPRGTEVVLTASPEVGSRFVGWTGPCQGTGTCRLTVGGPRQVEARFAPVERAGDKVQVVKTGRGRGTVTSSPPGISCGRQCSGLFPRGTEVVLRASAEAGSRFVGWTGPCQGTGTCRLTVGGPRQVEARFAPVCAAGTATVPSTKVATKPRRVLVAIRLGGRAAARVRLFHKGRKVKERTVTGLTKGLRTVRVDLPPAAPAGKYRVAIRVADACARTRMFERTISVPRPS
jgi:Divergent InlB B-repeat domain